MNTLEDALKKKYFESSPTTYPSFNQNRPSNAGEPVNYFKALATENYFPAQVLNKYNNQYQLSKHDYIDPTYNWRSEVPNDLLPFFHYFSETTNQEQAEYLRKEFRKQLRYQRKVDEHSILTNFLFNVPLAVADPINYFAPVSAAKAYKATGRLLTSFGIAAGTGALSAALSEGLAFMLLETRTPEQALANFYTSAMFSAALGAAGTVYGRLYYGKIMTADVYDTIRMGFGKPKGKPLDSEYINEQYKKGDGLQKEQKLLPNYDDGQTFTEGPTKSSGGPSNPQNNNPNQFYTIDAVASRAPAAYTPTARNLNLQQESINKMAKAALKVPAIYSPMARMLRGDFDTPRYYADLLFDHNIVKKKYNSNARFLPVENVIKNSLAERVEPIAEFINIYRDQAGLSNFNIRTLDKIPEKKGLGYKDFNERVARAMHFNDKDFEGNVAVEKAAATIRKLIDEGAKKLERHKNFPRNVPLKNKETYLTHVWDREKVVSDLPGAKNVLFTGFSQTNDYLKANRDAMVKAQKQIQKNELKLKKLKKKQQRLDYLKLFNPLREPKLKKILDRISKDISNLQVKQAKQMQTVVNRYNKEIAKVETQSGKVFDRLLEAIEKSETDVGTRQTKGVILKEKTLNDNVKKLQSEVANLEKSKIKIAKDIDSTEKAIEVNLEKLVEANIRLNELKDDLQTFSKTKYVKQIASLEQLIKDINKKKASIEKFQKELIKERKSTPRKKAQTVVKKYKKETEKIEKQSENALDRLLKVIEKSEKDVGTRQTKAAILKEKTIKDNIQKLKREVANLESSQIKSAKSIDSAEQAIDANLEKLVDANIKINELKNDLQTYTKTKYVKQIAALEQLNKDIDKKLKLVKRFKKELIKERQSKQNMEMRKELSKAKAREAKAKRFLTEQNKLEKELRNDAIKNAELDVEDSKNFFDQNFDLRALDTKGNIRKILTDEDLMAEVERAIDNILGMGESHLSGVDTQDLSSNPQILKNRHINLDYNLIEKYLIKDIPELMAHYQRNIAKVDGVAHLAENVMPKTKRSAMIARIQNEQIPDAYAKINDLEMEEILDGVDNTDKIKAANDELEALEAKVEMLQNEVTLTEILAQMKQDVKTELDDKLKNANTPKERAQLTTEFEKQISNLDDSVQMVFGTYTDRYTPNSKGFYEFIKTLNLFNYVRFLGHTLLISLKDFSQIIIQKGFGSVFSDLLGPSFRRMGKMVKADKINLETLRGMGLGINGHLSAISGAVVHGDDNVFPKSKFSSGLQTVSNLFGKLSGIDAYQNFLETANGHIAINDILTACNKFVKGTITKEEELFLNRYGIDSNARVDINNQFKKHGGTDSTYKAKYANESAWDDTPEGLNAYKAFKSAVRSFVAGTANLTGSGDKIASKNGVLGAIFGEFKQWIATFYNKAVVAGLSQGDLRLVMYAAVILPLGAAEYVVQSIIRNPDESRGDWDFSPSRLIMEAIDRSSMLGLLHNFTNAFRKALGMDVPTRAMNSTITGAFLGPSAGFAEEVLSILNKFSRAYSGNYRMTTKDMEAIMRFIPLQNLFWLDFLLKKIGKEVALGLGFRDRN